MNNKPRINYVDIILFITAAVIIVIFSFISFDGSSQIDFTQKDTVTLTLRIRNIPLKHTQLIKNGDTACFTSDEQTLGKIKYVNYDDETVEFLDKFTNTSTVYKTPDKCTALLLVECEAVFENGVFTVSNKELKQGDSIEAFVPDYSFTATVIKIENDEG